MYTVYKTTNLINGHIYIGVHKTDKPNDKYLGSGKYLKLAIKKYGRQNFKKEVLFMYSSLEEAYEKEKELVDKSFYLREDTYNLTGGGSYSVSYGKKKGGIGSMRGKKHKSETIEKIKKTLNETNLDPIVKENRKKGAKKAWVKMIANNTFNSWNKGKHLTEEDKLKKSIAALNKKKVECPHCGKITDPGNAKLWHFDNCKTLNPNEEIKHVFKFSLKVECPHCGLIGNGGNMKRYHFDNCKLKYIPI